MMVCNEKVALVRAIPEPRHHLLLDWLLAGESGGLIPLELSAFQTHVAGHSAAADLDHLHNHSASITSTVQGTFSQHAIRFCYIMPFILDNSCSLLCEEEVSYYAVARPVSPPVQ